MHTALQRTRSTARRDAWIPDIDIVVPVHDEQAVLEASIHRLHRYLSAEHLRLLLFEGIAFRDFPVVQATVLLGGVMIVVVNLLVDILYAVIDPRIRYEG